MTVYFETGSADRMSGTVAYSGSDRSFELWFISPSGEVVARSHPVYARVQECLEALIESDSALREKFSTKTARYAGVGDPIHLFLQGTARPIPETLEMQVANLIQDAFLAKLNARDAVIERATKAAAGSQYTLPAPEALTQGTSLRVNEHTWVQLRRHNDYVSIYLRDAQDRPLPAYSATATKLHEYLNNTILEDKSYWSRLELCDTAGTAAHLKVRLKGDDRIEGERLIRELVEEAFLHQFDSKAKKVTKRKPEPPPVASDAMPRLAPRKFEKAFAAAEEIRAKGPIPMDPALLAGFLYEQAETTANTKAIRRLAMYFLTEHSYFSTDGAVNGANVDRMIAAVKDLRKAYPPVDPDRETDFRIDAPRLSRAYAAAQKAAAGGPVDPLRLTLFFYGESFAMDHDLEAKTIGFLHKNGHHPQPPAKAWTEAERLALSGPIIAAGEAFLAQERGSSLSL